MAWGADLVGIELELTVLLFLSVLGSGVFAVFEIETPAWRKVVKWLMVIGTTLLLYSLIGHWSLMLPGLAAAAGTTFHFVWCRRHGIHPLAATPRRRYYELRGWRWPE